MNKEFESFLQDYFMELREIGGMPITKDNCEDLFDSWISDLDTEELLKYGTLFGNKRYIEGKEEVIKNWEASRKELNVQHN